MKTYTLTEEELKNKPKLLSDIEAMDTSITNLRQLGIGVSDQFSFVQKNRLEENKQEFQSRVHPWLVAAFGEDYIHDKTERIHRFVEEALELAQACGCSKNEALNLVSYVFSREVGEKNQEVGGVMTTLAALCQTQGLNMHEAGDTELNRIWGAIDKIRAKQDAKPSYKNPEAKTEIEEAELQGMRKVRDLFPVGSESWVEANMLLLAHA